MPASSHALGVEASAIAMAVNPPKISVPITSADVIGYFLLLEALQTSDHPDARSVATAVTDVLTRGLSSHVRRGDPSFTVGRQLVTGSASGLARRDALPRVQRQSFKTSHSNDFLIAWMIRTALIPPPSDRRAAQP